MQYFLYTSYSRESKKEACVHVKKRKRKKEIAMYKGIVESTLSRCEVWLLNVQEQVVDRNSLPIISGGRSTDRVWNIGL